MTRPRIPVTRAMIKIPPIPPSGLLDDRAATQSGPRRGRALSSLSVQELPTRPPRPAQLFDGASFARVDGQQPGSTCGAVAGPRPAPPPHGAGRRKIKKASGAAQSCAFMYTGDAAPTSSPSSPPLAIIHRAAPTSSEVSGAPHRVTSVKQAELPTRGRTDRPPAAPRSPVLSAARRNAAPYRDMPRGWASR
jgi:hypothetical protein